MSSSFVYSVPEKKTDADSIRRMEEINTYNGYMDKYFLQLFEWIHGKINMYTET